MQLMKCYGMLRHSICSNCVYVCVCVVPVCVLCVCARMLGGRYKMTHLHMKEHTDTDKACAHENM